MKKVIGYVLLIICVVVINITMLAPKTAKADPPVNYCYGYYWIHCTSGEYVIRCSCDGGPTCYAAWQDFC